jgi:hypothetical protein
MATINASTKISVPKKKPSIAVGAAKSVIGAKKPSGTAARRGSVAPPLKPATLSNASNLARLQESDSAGQIAHVRDLFRQALGEHTTLNLGSPKAASTTRDRAGAAADVAVAAKTLGVRWILKKCGIVDEMQRMLFPGGIEEFLARNADNESEMNGNGSTPMTGGLKASASAVSLASMDEVTTVTSANSLGTDTKRGKTTPANAREGCLLVIRALCQIVGKAAEPFVVGAFLAAALDECASSSGAIREAAEDASTAIVALANPWAFRTVLCPLLLQSLKSTEWRTKACTLERLEQCASTASAHVYKMIPTLIPAVGNQVWDTKAQVSKGSRAALLAICNTNNNRDIKKTIPAIVNAMCKPSETNKAVSELMGTTFVVPVDASTLAMLCPILARALKEKLAIHKRAACIVISNMSKLVETPDAVAPFGSLLVPELQKVSHNVQFEEIRDEALKALANLTKALGDAYKLTDEDDQAAEMANEKAEVEAEQKRIEDVREAERLKEEAVQKREEEERKKFKEAMDAQRELTRLEAEEAERQRSEEETKREAARLSTKGGTGKCQGCGLKKCKKTCMFYSED